MESFDVLVIGAGIAGATAAAHCAATARVALMEAEETAGFHSTGRSAAIWIQNYGPPDVRRLSAASRAFFAAPPAGFAAGPLFARRPVVTVAPAGQAAVMQAMLSEGEGLEPLPVAEVAAMGPPLRPGYAVAAAIERDAFDIDVAALHAGFLKAARAAGGVLALRTRAGRIWHDRGLWHAAATDGTVFRGRVLVNAAGAWGDEVAALAGVAPIGLQPKRRTALIIDPGQHDCSAWPLVGDAAHSWYVRPEARRKLMVSPADETDMPPHDVQPDELDIAIAIDRMQQALDIPVTRVEHRWAGLRSFTPDRSLAIGFDPDAPGFLWMIGQGGYGIQTAPAAGRLVAGLVAGAVAEALMPVVPLVDPARFRSARA
ncbi:NAD(P)/FAD-dependent oxidoreductase [Falsiroseomonas selenitidurans]|uniref:FAD-binding oxidoreductase n=1 Tax=Falsiroseomonas selenitidurans TaxID=2716335 RepID=A0ABX1E729_9PROT|nr:FAD-binding oxidoreductase [Falsiroseomonas selenitidurans]NKC32535.1 FAD-binding oxidoreductase [Falsiroseomonas selenitidurans]